MENNNELAVCYCCENTVRKGDMYFCKDFFDTYEVVDGEYIYSGYMVCEECHNSGK